jgi:hypothetical protein
MKRKKNKGSQMGQAKKCLKNSVLTLEKFIDLFKKLSM